MLCTNIRPYKVGYTTGVFDLFHIGHLNILRRAKELCEYLIVGVSTDECVKSYKNKIPTIPFEKVELRVPVGLHNFLTERFGDYMVPPSAERIKWEQHAMC